MSPLFLHELKKVLACLKFVLRLFWFNLSTSSCDSVCK